MREPENLPHFADLSKLALANAQFCAPFARWVQWRVRTYERAVAVKELALENNENVWPNLLLLSCIVVFCVLISTLFCVAVCVMTQIDASIAEVLDLLSSEKLSLEHAAAIKLFHTYLALLSVWEQRAAKAEVELEQLKAADAQLHAQTQGNQPPVVKPTAATSAAAAAAALATPATAVPPANTPEFAIFKQREESRTRVADAAAKLTARRDKLYSDKKRALSLADRVLNVNADSGAMALLQQLLTMIVQDKLVSVRDPPDYQPTLILRMSGKSCAARVLYPSRCVFSLMFIRVVCCVVVCCEQMWSARQS
jgi:hypothetical protein